MKANFQIEKFFFSSVFDCYIVKYNIYPVLGCFTLTTADKFQVYFNFTKTRNTNGKPESQTNKNYLINIIKLCMLKQTGSQLDLVHKLELLSWWGTVLYHYILTVASKKHLNHLPYVVAIPQPYCLPLMSKGLYQLQIVAVS